MLYPQGHELSSGGRVTITAEDGVACLVIENITADDSGKYVVSVENSLGADCHFASVAVEGKSGTGLQCVEGSRAVAFWHSCKRLVL
jgi:hypothetical protein